MQQPSQVEQAATVSHSLAMDDLLSQLRTEPAGLTDEEAAKRIAQNGPNVLTGKKKTPLLHIFLHQLASPLVYILIVAAILKFAFGTLLDGFVILGVLSFMALVGFIQEARARTAMEALLRMVSPKARVKREKTFKDLPAKELVPGDVIQIEAGSHVPADCRILEAAGLKVDESAFTGESLPVSKAAVMVAGDAVISERKNMVYMGTIVSSGRARAVVVATGMSTEIGKLAGAMQLVKEQKTPLQKGIARLGHILIGIVLISCVLLVTIGIVRGFSVIDITMLAVAVAVAAIPEGLPAVVTVLLAIGMQVMARHNAIIRKLVAVETLGSATIICSDKTGTLTLNQMTVKRIFCAGGWIEVTGQGYDPEGTFKSGEEDIDRSSNGLLDRLLRAAVLCNDADLKKEKGAWDILGDPTEGALIVAGAKAGMQKEDVEKRFPRVAEIPFRSEHQYMATMHRGDKGAMVFVKGSVEKILALCGHVMKDQGTAELDDAEKASILQANEALGKHALRVLALAEMPFPETEQDIGEELISGRLTFLGLVGMIDPPREEAKKAIAACKMAGIKVAMVTGDNKVTADAIAAQLGLAGGKSISGAELARLSDKELHEQIEDFSVFARIEPLHKLRIIDGLKSRGHVVAMTGDGVNDAPALEAANIGIAMGITGTDVAKEASDMVLADDNFATIVTAVEEGRAIFNRLRNVLLFLLCTSIGELLILLSCVLFFGKSPLSPLQILWINLITGTLLAIPLGLEPKGGDELAQPPRHPRVGLLYPGLLTRILFLSTIFAVGVTLMFGWLASSLSFAAASTIVFCSIVIFEWFVSLNARSGEKTVFGIGFFSNPWLLAAIGVAVLFQLAVVYLPMLQVPFATVPLRAGDWMIAFLPGLLVFVIETAGKIIAPKFFNFGKFKPVGST